MFDDVSFDFGAGSPRSVIQVHHGINSTRELLDTSAKVWRTFAIWTDAWRDLDAAEDVVMTLVSTQPARAGSGIASLRPGSRDLNHAIETLTAVAEERGGAKGTAADRARFLSLDEAERRALLSRVTVADEAARATDVRAELKRILQPSHEERFVASMADQVEGAWWPLVVTALQTKQPIGIDAIGETVDEARRALSDNALPILRLEDFSDDELPPGDPQNARYIRCLLEIKASARRREQAIEDFGRAFAHRSRWGRRGLLGPLEFERYEGDLLAQWLIASDRMLREVDGETEDERLAAAGHTMWDVLEADVRQPLRPHTTDTFIQRGSLHGLANDERLAWHPNAARGFHEVSDVEDSA
ncbi:ABC-three component system protein [Patulibacter sp. NPDC049589]|uniref:ABC-three component system protein n=1 Tax=Patulibacter sp. NPDC049589 TaxID=3154731 RepID=UPI00341E770E